MWIYIQYSKIGINNSQPILLVRQRPVEQTGSSFPGPGSLRMGCGDRRQSYETLSPFPTGPVSQACLVPSPSHITGGDMEGRTRVSGILMHPCNPWLSPWGQNVMQIPHGWCVCVSFNSRAVDWHTLGDDVCSHRHCSHEALSFSSFWQSAHCHTQNTGQNPGSWSPLADGSWSSLVSV